MDNEEALSNIGSRARKQLDKALLPNEVILAVPKGREAKVLVLTGSRAIIASGSFPFGGHDVVPLSDVSRMSSGLTGVSIGMRNGDDAEFGFWPNNIKAAEALVQTFRSVQAAGGGRSAGIGATVADELEKLGRLREQGVLTDQEFQAQKAQLLAR